MANISSEKFSCLPSHGEDVADKIQCPRRTVQQIYKLSSRIGGSAQRLVNFFENFFFSVGQLTIGYSRGNKKISISMDTTFSLTK